MLSCAYKNIREPGKHNLLALGTNCFFRPLLQVFLVWGRWRP